jgi:hypothetical protein
MARKLAVLLHHRWVSGEVYEPLRKSPPIALTTAGLEKQFLEVTSPRRRVLVTALVAWPNFPEPRASRIPEWVR